MITRDQFITRYSDEMTGLMMASFAQTTKTHHLAADTYAEDGRFVLAQMRRARELLGKIYDDNLKPPEPPKPAELPKAVAATNNFVRK